MPASIPADEPAIERTILFEEETDGFRLYRIPGIVVTAQGTALAYCEARKFSIADRGEIEIHLRRSTDGGRTWDAPRQIAHLGPRLPRNPHLPADKRGKDMGGPNEQTVNNPMAIAARDGTVHFVYCVEYMRCFYMRSDDDGVTWSQSGGDHGHVRGVSVSMRLASDRHGTRPRYPVAERSAGRAGLDRDLHGRFVDPKGLVGHLQRRCRPYVARGRDCHCRRWGGQCRANSPTAG